MDRSRWTRRESPRAIVLGLLILSFAWGVVVPLWLTSPPSAAHGMALAGGLALFGAALVAALWAAVSPSSGALGWSPWATVLMALALWYPVYAWAEDGEQPWAWLAGLAIAAIALVSPPAGLAAGVVLVLAAGVGGRLFDGSVVANVVIAAGCALVVWLMCQVMVWLLRLLRAARAAGEAEAELAVAEERLRVSRELHDALGHRLSIIALKAELAGALAGRDPAASAAESEAIRALAAETLAEARKAVHGETAGDLATQLDAAELVLTSAGIATAIDADRKAVARLPDRRSRLLAAVLREAVTNVLRHSDARRVTITFTDGPASARLVIVNDEVRDPGLPEPAASGGTGLAALSARCSAAGARLVAGPDGDGGFEVLVEVPST